MEKTVEIEMSKEDIIHFLWRFTHNSHAVRANLKIWENKTGYKMQVTFISNAKQ
jgi:hypothetical protein